MTDFGGEATSRMNPLKANKLNELAILAPISLMFGKTK